jgi:hypothetical protein
VPQLNHRITTEQALSYEARLLLAILLDEINTLRTQAGLPERTMAQVRTAVRQYIREQPRTGGSG